MALSLKQVIKFLPILFGGQFLGDFGVSGEFRVGGTVHAKSGEFVTGDPQNFLVQSEFSRSAVSDDDFAYWDGERRLIVTDRPT